MGFPIYCDNKKCRELQEPLLDKETDQVHCSKCDGVIEHVSIFTKRQMRAMGQVKRDSVPKQAFAVKCESCEKIMCPIMKEDEEKHVSLHCPACDSHHSHISAPYAQTVIAFLKKAL